MRLATTATAKSNETTHTYAENRIQNQKKRARQNPAHLIIEKQMFKMLLNQFLKRC